MVKVPSVVFIDFDGPGYQARIGSGKVGVENTNDSTVSSQSVFIPWSWRQTVTEQNPLIISPKDRHRIYLSNPNGTGGYTLELDTSLQSHPEYEAAIRKAARDWTCATGVNWNITAGYTGIDALPSQTYAHDNVNLIKVRPYGAQTNNRVAQTHPKLNLCYQSHSGQPPLGSLEGVDWVFAWPVLNRTMLFDTTGTATKDVGEMDLYHIALHELGHALGFLHVNRQNDAMWYNDRVNEQLLPHQRGQIMSWHANAGIHIVNSSEVVAWTNNCIALPHHVSNLTADCTSWGGLSIENTAPNGPLQLSAFPNPTSGQFILRYTPNVEPSTILVQTVTGQVLKNRTVKASTTCAETFDLNGLSSSIYLVTVTTDSAIQTLRVAVQ